MAHGARFVREENFMQNRNKGFTLTELLIVVMVIGILAAVTVPKFNKVFATRQTSEAEDILLAVRQEQVALCASGQPYTSDVEEIGALDSLSKFNNTARSKYFIYQVTIQCKEPTKCEAGVQAGNDTLALRIPSFEDGRICCYKGCETLNKDYPACDSLEISEEIRKRDAYCTAIKINSEEVDRELL